MPYFLCDMCRTSKAISGQVEVNRETGEGHCRLLIRKPRRAEEFIVNIGGRGTACHGELVRRIAETTDSPWESLSLVVQNRLASWYKATRDEQFMAYIPDRDRARTEDGMCGLVVSSRRFINHSSLRHHEQGLDQPLEFEMQIRDNLGHVHIVGGGWDAHVKLDGDGISNLRRALVKGKFRAIWR